jgi:hypothetical protein
MIPPGSQDVQRMFGCGVASCQRRVVRILVDCARLTAELIGESRPSAEGRSILALQQGRA